MSASFRRWNPTRRLPNKDRSRISLFVDDASPTAESPGYIADSDSMEEDTVEDFIDYPDEPEDGEDEPEDDNNDDDTDDEDEEPTEGEEEARKTVRLEPPMSVSMKARIVEHAAAPIPPTNPAYDQAPLGHRAAMIPESFAAAARLPKGQYDFVDTVEAGQGLFCSPGHDARTIARADDRAEDVGYVRALQASEHRMMTSIEVVKLRVSYQAQVCRQESADFHTQLLDARTDLRDIRLKIDVVRGQRTAYETELHERAEDDAVRQMMRIHVLEDRAQIDKVEDTDSSY
ncbi:hypothetical protein Tco_0358946 [Tanacetum coccineum]